MSETTSSEAVAFAQTAQRSPTASPAKEGPRPESMFRRRIDPVSALEELWRYREIVISLAERDIRSRYKQALLGFAWALVTPLAFMLVFTLVFTRFAKIDTGGAPYVLFAYLGLIPWTFFNNCVSVGGMSLVNNLALVNKVYCPREHFPLAAMAVAAFDTVMSLAVLIVLFPATGYAPKLETVYVPLLVLVELFFAAGITLLASSVLVYLRDLRYALPLALQIGLFATPVAYGSHTIAKSATAQDVYAAVNPLAPVIDGFRRTVLMGLAPNWTQLLIGAASSVVVLVAGFAVFKKLETGIADIA